VRFFRRDEEPFMSRFRFDADDLRLALPVPGWYPAHIQHARFRRSSSNNRMLELVYAVAELDPAYTRLGEYFVLEGGSAFGLSRTRRRLVELYRACGIDPKPDDEISPSALIGKAVEVELGLEQWRGQPRVAVLSHRRPLNAQQLSGAGS
jgi:hypothetical protein